MREVELVTAASDSDTSAPESAEAFAEWVSPHVTRMGYLAARLAPESDRDDIVQEALVRAWRKRRQFDPRRGTIATWLLAITADQARHARRGRRANILESEIAADDPDREGWMDVSAAANGWRSIASTSSGCQLPRQLQ
jgi:DNA-directed RNA polymerase specialized sigma24 family protein